MRGSTAAPVSLLAAAFVGCPPPGRWRVEAAAQSLADQVEALRRRLPPGAPVIVVAERRPRSVSLLEALAQALRRRGLSAAWQAAPAGRLVGVLVVSREAEDLALRAVGACRPRQGWEQACMAVGAALGVEGLTVLAQDACPCLAAGLRRAGARVVETD